MAVPPRLPGGRPGPDREPSARLRRWLVITGIASAVVLLLVLAVLLLTGGGHGPRPHGTGGDGQPPAGGTEHRPPAGGHG